ncbi:MAG: peptidylprolyl isomerase [Ruminococcus sp.]|nr:peptidylprolyl isomerase [Ruminococcus sp.]
MRICKCAAAAVSAVMALSLLAGCSEDDPLEEAVVGKDSFIMTLYPDIAPITCANFQSLVEEGFYNGLTFHRVVDEFVAQGGDPSGDGTGGSGKAITGEFSENGVNNTLSHTRGTVSMARADDYNSATCQFFICYTDLTYLDGTYASFGVVTEGMEVVDGFLDVPRSVGRMGEISVPDTPIVIEHAAMIESDSAGNPRVQFVVDVKPGEASEKETDTAAETAPPETAPSETSSTETETAAVSEESVG